MNKDIRISTTLCHHPKTYRLITGLGYEGFFSLVALWGFAGEYRPKGRLTKMSEGDICLAAQWKGDPEKFVKFLDDVGWLDWDSDCWAIHDWGEHNGFAFFADERKELAKKAARAKWGNNGQKNTPNTRAERMALARSKGNHKAADWENMKEFFGVCVACRGESGLDHLDRDHITPVYQGGCHGIRNIQPLCAKCNANKGPDATDHRVSYCQENNIKMPDEWRRDLCQNYECCLLDACGPQALTPTPSPTPTPTPTPKPLPKKGAKSADKVKEGGVGGGDFDKFWKAYPKKVGKKHALKSWKAARDKPALVAILNAVEEQIKSDQWQRGFIPNPATWINQGRWEDEPTNGGPRVLERSHTDEF